MAGKRRHPRINLGTLLLAGGLLLTGEGFAAEPMKGQVLGAGAPIAGSTVTLWAAGSGPPTELLQTRTDVDGRFTMNVPDAEGATSFYLVAQRGQAAANEGAGNNDRIALMTVLGAKP